MASWGVLLGLCGFEYHGPHGHLGFAPRITPDDFWAAFTAAEGWGTLAQTRESGNQTCRIEMKWGKLALNSLAFELPEDAKIRQTSIVAARRPIAAQTKQEGSHVVVALAEPVELQPNQAIEVTFSL